MKPPPLLLGLTLLFWGWQTDLLLPGALMAVILESAWVVKARWEFSDADFRRVWTFCALALLAASLYAFTAHEGPANFAGLFQDANLVAQRNASISSGQTVMSVLRWLPMIFFPFLAAQTFSTREAIPLTIISLILQRRWKLAKRHGQPLPPQRNVNIGYVYFSGVLFSASFHPSETQSFYWGLSGLLTWALWSYRSRRFAVPVWLGAMAVAVALGYFGQLGVARLQRYVAMINPQWIANMLRRPTDPSQSQTALGQVGRIKLSEAIVIRVEPRDKHPVPAYLREASYRMIKRQTWYAGSSRNDYQQVTEDPPLESARWTLLPGKTNLARVRIASYLDGYEDGSPAGLLPLPTGTARLEQLQAYLLRKNSAGAVLAQGPGLLIFDALYGSEATIDSPPDSEPDSTRPTGFNERLAESNSPTNRPPPRAGKIPPLRFGEHEDLQVPDIEKPALDQVIVELHLSGRSQAEVLRTLTGFFNDKFTYRMWQPRRRDAAATETPLTRFLLHDRAGHCEYFATATVLLLRQLGIPARYATGYAVHEESGSGYVVRLSDAHAWTLVWDPEARTWFDFDTTPASWVKVEGSKSNWRWLSDALARIRFEFARFRWGQSHVREYLLWIMVPGLAVLLYQILFRRGRRRHAGSKSDEDFFANYPGLDSDFYELEKEIARRGVPRSPSEPLNEWLRRVAETPDFTGWSGPLRELLRLHYRYRFDPLGLDEADRKALHEQTRACLASLSQRERAMVAAGE